MDCKLLFAGLVSNDNGEIFQETLIREIKECTGVDVEIIDFIGLCKNIENGGEVLVL